MEQILIIGCGYVGTRIARLAMEQNISVTAVARSPESGEKLAASHVDRVYGNLDEPDSLSALPTRGRIVFYLAPPPGGGLTDPRLRAFCAAINPGEEPRKVVYMSTTGVYGNCSGDEVTEETSPRPQTSRARRRYDAEMVLLEWGKERRVPVVILRVPGIYGPGRLPLPQIESGSPIISEREAPFTNRIHVDDLASVCMAAAEKGDAGDIFNVSDGVQDTMTHYFNAVADAFGLPRPPQVSRKEAEHVMNPLILSYFSESRRVGNKKMLEKLGVSLRYPSLEAGLKGSMRPEN